MPNAHKFLSLLIVSVALTGCGEKESDSNSAATPQPQASEPITASAQPDFTPPTEQEAAFLAAAVKGDTNLVKTLLDKGVNINVRDKETNIALGHASWAGHADTVKLLIERGADINATRKDGATPLLLANWSKHLEIAEMLKKAGAR